jgi:hypothetical protein
MVDSSPLKQPNKRHRGESASDLDFAAAGESDGDGDSEVDYQEPVNPSELEEGSKVGLSPAGRKGTNTKKIVQSRQTPQKAQKTPKKVATSAPRQKAAITKNVTPSKTSKSKQTGDTSKTQQKSASVKKIPISAKSSLAGAENNKQPVSAKQPELGKSGTTPAKKQGGDGAEHTVPAKLDFPGQSQSPSAATIASSAKTDQTIKKNQTLTKTSTEFVPKETSGKLRKAAAKITGDSVTKRDHISGNTSPSPSKKPVVSGKNSQVPPDAAKMASKLSNAQSSELNPSTDVPKISHTLSHKHKSNKHTTQHNANANFQQSTSSRAKRPTYPQSSPAIMESSKNTQPSNTIPAINNVSPATDKASPLQNNSVQRAPIIDNLLMEDLQGLGNQPNTAKFLSQVVESRLDKTKEASCNQSRSRVEDPTKATEAQLDKTKEASCNQS